MIGGAISLAQGPLAAGQIPGFPEFRVDRPANHNHRLTASEYAVSDKLIAAVKAFIREHKELKVDEARVDKDAAWLKRQIRFEVTTAAFGQEVARGALNEGDAQIQRALAEMPKAKVLVEDFVKVRASRIGEARRN